MKRYNCFYVTQLRLGKLRFHPRIPEKKAFPTMLDYSFYMQEIVLTTEKVWWLKHPWLQVLVTPSYLYDTGQVTLPAKIQLFHL